MNIPNLQHAAASRTSPNADNILTVADADNATADLLADLLEGLAKERKARVLPVSVGNALLQTQDPFTAAAVDLVLPDGPDASLEKVVLPSHRQLRGVLEVAEADDKLLDGLAVDHGSQGLGVLLVRLALGLTRPAPGNPLIFQRVHLEAGLWAGDLRRPTGGTGLRALAGPEVGGRPGLGDRGHRGGLAIGTGGLGRRCLAHGKLERVARGLGGFRRTKGRKSPGA